MSLAALLVGVRDELRSVLGIQAIQIGIQEDGQPPPGMGASLYISVHPLRWKPTTSREIIQGLDESYAIGVTITKRISYVPEDRKNEEVFLKSLVGFEKLSRRIMVAVHQNWDVIERANNYIISQKTDDLEIDPVMEWLRWESTQEVPTPRDGTWLWETREEFIPRVASETVTIVFSEARRVQRSTVME